MAFGGDEQIESKRLKDHDLDDWSTVHLMERPHSGREHNNKKSKDRTTEQRREPEKGQEDRKNLFPMKRDTDKTEGHMRPAIPECGRDNMIQQIQEIGLQKDITFLSQEVSNEVEQKLQECLTMHQNESG